MFLDASAIVCIMTGEPEAAALVSKLDSAPRRLTSALAAYEASQAVARKRRWTAEEAGDLVEEFLMNLSVEWVLMGRDEFRAALDAHDRFGKGRHPARLNMGDCFAYACARNHKAPLLFKGEDFAMTDVLGA